MQLSVILLASRCKYANVQRPSIPNKLLLVSRGFFFVVVVVFFLLEAKFNLLSALRKQIYALACAHTISTVLAAMQFFKILKLLLALIFRCAHFKFVAMHGWHRCANQKVIIYVCWLTTTTKEINNHIEFTHWAQQVRVRELTGSRIFLRKQTREKWKIYGGKNRCRNVLAIDSRSHIAFTFGSRVFGCCCCSCGA